MRLLVAFDKPFELEAFRQHLESSETTSLHIFPLLADPQFLETLQHYLDEQIALPVVWCNTAKRTQQAVTHLRKEIHQWSFAFSESTVNNKSLKVHFLLPGRSLSTWWLSLLAEKNTVKSELFFCLAQVNAIQDYCRETPIDRCLFAIEHPELQSSLKALMRTFNQPYQHLTLNSTVERSGMKNTLRVWLRRSGFLGQCLLGLNAWLRCMACGIVARRLLPPRATRMIDPCPLLFVSYFPYLDPEKAKEGIYINKQAYSLQQYLQTQQHPMTWLFMPVRFDDYTFKSACEFAARFTKTGEKLLVLQEFAGWSFMVKTLGIWLVQIAKSFRIWQHVKNRLPDLPTINQVHRPIIQALWHQSFVGAIGYNEIAHYYLFKSVFSAFKQIDQCLYYFENQAWEKGLNAAKNIIDPRIKTIAYQHASYPLNFFPYFMSPSETSQNNLETDCPLPNITAVNGRLAKELMAHSAYPNPIVLEAIRYFYLNEKLQAAQMTKSIKPTLLVIGSMDKTDALSLIRWVHQAFPSTEHYHIRFKPHPSLSLAPLFEQLGIDWNALGYQLCVDDLSEYIHESWAVFVSGSTVSIEALACDCEVITPCYPNVMSINALEGYEQYYHQVTSSQELLSVMQQIAGGYKKTSFSQKKAFIKEYWEINPALTAWKQLLSHDRESEYVKP